MQPIFRFKLKKKIQIYNFFRDSLLKTHKTFIYKKNTQIYKFNDVQFYCNWRIFE